MQCVVEEGGYNTYYNTYYYAYICKGRFKVALYDKRNDLSFNVASDPCLDGNIPKKTYPMLFLYSAIFLNKYSS